MEILKYRITSIDSVDDIRIFRLEPEEKGLDYKPGHFAMLHHLDMSGKSTVHRPYSIASSPARPYIEFCIKMVGGKLTSILEGAKLGDVYGISGPMGHFTYKGQERCAFIAGGTGIAPFMSMLRYICDKGIEGDFTLFYSVRSRDIIIYRKELEELNKKQGISIVITLTREKPESWEGECGRIDGDMLERHAENHSETHWYLCGPLKMTTCLRGCLIERGVSDDKITFEGWG